MDLDKTMEKLCVEKRNELLEDEIVCEENLQKIVL